jgi:hypothetical protein
VEQARFYAARGDWFSAHYYAEAAASADPRRRDAFQIMSEASRQLAVTPAAPGAAGGGDEGQLFARKKEALARLESGDAVGAYYAFLALQGVSPRDPDIAGYLKRASDEVEKQYFFLDEARKVELLPGTQSILFLNRGDAGSTEAVSIAKMVQLPGGDDYFFGIEAVRYDEAGVVAWHFTAPYGRREGRVILMAAVDRADPAVRSTPRYLQGGRPAAERSLLRLEPDAQELRVLSSGRSALAAMSIGEMWRLRPRLGDYGLGRQSLGVELAMRLVMPFAFLVLSILCTAMGWSLRIRDGRRSAAAILLMPLLPVMLALLSLLYLHAHRLVIGFTVIGFGLGTAFVALGVLQVVLLGVSLALLAGQSSR